LIGTGETRPLMPPARAAKTNTKPSNLLRLLGFVDQLGCGDRI
jgi:hypothetical protein